jgi:hypothetical protein
MSSPYVAPEISNHLKIKGMDGILMFRNQEFGAICILITSRENRCFVQRMYAMRWGMAIHNKQFVSMWKMKTKVC